MYSYKSARLTNVKVDDIVFASRMELAMGPMLRAVTKKTEETGRIAAFDLKWKEGEPFKPHVFWDSDVAKVLEGMAYILALAPDPELEKLYDSWVDRVVSAQQSDGYLNTYFTVVEPDKRFTQLNWAHELYCAGHLIEAAVAGFEGKGFAADAPKPDVIPFGFVCTIGSSVKEFQALQPGHCPSHLADS